MACQQGSGQTRLCEKLWFGAVCALWPVSADASGRSYLPGLCSGECGAGQLSLSFSPWLPRLVGAFDFIRLAEVKNRVEEQQVVLIRSR